jgi:ArsR family transcriptional regulator
MKSEQMEKEARLFKALANPARLEILEVLRHGEQCVCHIEAVLGYRQAYISQQLMVLREAGLVSDRKDGWNSYYRASRPEVFDLTDQAASMTGAAEDGFRYDDKPANCPCPKCAALLSIAAK